jgi:hypothetical protein
LPVTVQAAMLRSRRKTDLQQGEQRCGSWESMWARGERVR